MHSDETLIGTVLAVVSVLLLTVSAFASAQPPYIIHGLHSELTLAEALAQAEKLGGDCQEIATRQNEEGRNIQCGYRHCDEAATAGDCNAEDIALPALTFAQQPIVSIVLQAPADAARLTRIVLIYSGVTETVATGLIDAFGPTEGEGTPSDTQSWSHARRWSWREGAYLMGLLNSPQWITLATDRLPAVPAGKGTEAAD